jgi:hypothetical protein
MNFNSFVWMCLNCKFQNSFSIFKYVHYWVFLGVMLSTCFLTTIIILYFNKLKELIKFKMFQIHYFDKNWFLSIMIHVYCCYYNFLKIILKHFMNF